MNQRRFCQNFVLQKLRPGGEIHGPGENIRLKAFFSVEPGISAKDLIGAFSGQGDLVMLCNLFAEIEHGALHIRHAGEIPGIHCLK